MRACTFFVLIRNKLRLDSNANFLSYFVFIEHELDPDSEICANVDYYYFQIIISKHTNIVDWRIFIIHCWANLNGTEIN